jgi:tetratricopeptide (TPR) repeat protein
MVKRAFSLLFLAVFALSCRTADPKDKSAIPKARPPQVAVDASKTVSDAATAAEIAWIEGNNAAAALERLNAALEKTPHDPALLLRRALISSSLLDERPALDDLLAILSHAPDSAEAEVGLLILTDALADHLSEREKIVAALDAAGYLADHQTRPLRVLLAAHIKSRIELLAGNETAMRTAIDRGGFLTSFSLIGPLAPRAQRSLALVTEHEKSGIDAKKAVAFRGLVPPVREVHAYRTSVAPVSGERSGLYVLESYFLVGEDAKDAPLTLSINMHDSGRVSIDGTQVFASERGVSRPRGYGEVEMKLAPGWHRFTLTILAVGSTRPTFSLLRNDGKKVIVSQSAHRPKGPLPAEHPVIAKRARDYFHPESAEAWVEQLWSQPEHALFAGLAGALLGGASHREDLDRADHLLSLALEAAPQSAQLLASEARFMMRFGFPRSLAQARLREAVALDKTFAAALLALARSIAEDSPDAALELLERAEATNPRSAGPHILKFRILEQRGWRPQAARELQKALALDESEALLSDAASFYRNTMRVAKAEEIEKKLERYAEPSPPAMRAQLALKKGELDKAITELREAARTTSIPATHLARVATLELSRGKLDAAKSAAEEALKADPLNQSAQRVLVLIQRSAPSIERLRELGASDVKMETFAASLRGGVPGLPESGSWLEKKLAVDARVLVAASKDADLKWSRHKSVRLLERIVDEVRPDGSSLSLKHAVTRLMTKEATDEAGEINLSNEAIPLALRTIKADGRIIEVDRHAGKEDLSFSALAPGDAVEYQWVELLEPATSYGGYGRRFFFRGAQPGLRSEYVVIVEKGTKVWYQLYHGAPKPEIHEEKDKTIYLFRTEESLPVEPEPYSVSHEEFVPFVVVAVDFDRNIGLRANVLGLETIAETSYSVRRQAEQLTEDLASEEDRIRAIHEFIAREIGNGGSRDASLVLATRRGDRTGLFIAMLRSIGIDAQLVLARPANAARVEPEYPSSQQFTTDLVRINLSSGTGPLWARMDLSSPWLGRATPDLRNGKYIVAGGNEPTPKIYAFTKDDIDHWPLLAAVDLEVSEDGHAKGSISLTVPGSFGSNLRTFLRAVRTDEASRALEGFASGVLPGALLESFDTENMEDALAPLILRLAISVPHFMVLERDTLIAEQFFAHPVAGRALGMGSLAGYLRVPNRTTPMYVGEIDEQMTVRVVLPKSASKPAEAPRTFKLSIASGEIAQTFEWNDAEKIGLLTVSHKIPPQRISVADFPKFRDSVQQILQSTRNRLITPIKPVSKNPRAANP